MLEAAREANPTNQALQGDLAWVDTLLGNSLLSAGRRAEALQAYERALAARVRLSKASPTTTRHIEQQIGIHRMIASLHAQAGRSADALASCERARLIGEQAAESHTSAPAIRQELAYVYSAYGDLMLKRGDPSEALAQYERMRMIEDILLKAYPNDPRFRSAHADSVRRKGTALQASGRAADAIACYRQSAAELERLEKPTPVDIYDIACCRSLIAGAAADAGSGLTLTEGQAEAERAVAGVRRACQAGYSDLDLIRERDPDLEPIRSRPDFVRLMMDVNFPQDPFVQSD